MGMRGRVEEWGDEKLENENNGRMGEVERWKKGKEGMRMNSSYKFFILPRTAKLQTLALHSPIQSLRFALLQLRSRIRKVLVYSKYDGGNDGC